MSKINAKNLAEAIAAALAPVLVAAFGGAAATNDDGDDTGDEPKKGRGRPAGSTNKSKPEKTAPAKGNKGKKDEEEEEEEDDGLGDEGDDDLGLGDEEEEVTQEDVVNAFKALKASKGIDKCREVLAKLDESNVLNIPAKKYAEALKEINRAGSKK